MISSTPLCGEGSIELMNPMKYHAKPHKVRRRNTLWDPNHKPVQRDWQVRTSEGMVRVSAMNAEQFCDWRESTWTTRRQRREKLAARKAAYLASLEAKLPPVHHGPVSAGALLAACVRAHC